MIQVIRKLSIGLNMIGLKIRNLARSITGKQLKPVSGIRVSRDVAVPMRDGVRLMINVYSPEKAGRYPVILCMTPYGKDEQPEHYELLKAARIRVGEINTSDFAIFEGPDPGVWVPAGYLLIHANARGMWNSEGDAYVFSQQNGHDYYDLIEWAAGQEWSTGKIGLAGVSYLAWAQWMAASLQPPHLSAICPWEGFSDMYREIAYQGGIPEVEFIKTLYVNRFKAHYNRDDRLVDDLPANAERHQLDDDYWADKRPDLGAILVPALVCASWSDQGLHTRGSLEGFKQIASQNKWLYTHGRKKWETYYSRESLDIQKMFFDHFLKGIENEMPLQPRVRLEVRTSYYNANVRFETGWPLPDVRYRRFFLDAETGELSGTPVDREGFIRYHSRPGKSEDHLAGFDYQFLKDTELTGGMNLRLWVEAEDTDDLDLFIAIKKLDEGRKEVHFSGYNCNEYDMVAKGWLRASLRELDPARTTAEQPWYRFRRMDKPQKGEIVPVEIEIWPSCTLFEKRSFLRLEVMGHEPLHYASFRHGRPVNKGYHRIYTGGKYDSSLFAPVVRG